MKRRLRFYFRLRKFLLLKLLIIAVSGSVIYKFDKICIMISPQNYWGEKVSSLEYNLRNSDWKIRELEIRIDKESLIEEMELKTYLAKAEVFDENKEDFIETQKERYEAKLADLKLEIEKQKAVKERKEKELAMARARYAACGYR